MGPGAGAGPWSSETGVRVRTPDPMKRYLGARLLTWALRPATEEERGATGPKAVLGLRRCLHGPWEFSGT